MRSINIILFAAAVCILASSCTPAPIPEVPQDIEREEEYKEDPGNGEEDGKQEQSMTIKITVGSKEFKADIEDSETGRAFIAKLPLTLEMSELNGNEKYCYGVSLPKADKRYDSISAGDLMLYSGNCIVLFYGPAGGYSYTRIGKLTSTSGLAAALGKGDVTVVFEGL